MPTRSIRITGQDMQRLRHLLGTTTRASARDQEHLETLWEELDRAIVVSAEDAPADVITMRTRVRVRDLESGQRDEYTVVYPWEADVASNRVSVLAPLGTALLGYREGDQLEWRMPGGVRRLRVEKILDQPEATRRSAPAAEGVAGRDALLSA
jgi:regulator of nucleoside diphosphate kinase